MSTNSQTNPNPLTPCPFCGSVFVSVSARPAQDRTGSWCANACCNECGAEGPFALAPARDAAHARATDLWNRRAAPAATPTP